MVTFLDEIAALMADVNLDEVEAPDEEVGEFEKVVGTAPDHMKRLWGIRGKLAATVDVLEKENRLLTVGQEARRGGIESELHFILERAKTLNALFWMEVRCAFP